VASLCVRAPNLRGAAPSPTVAQAAPTTPAAPAAPAKAGKHAARASTAPATAVASAATATAAESEPTYLTSSTPVETESAPVWVIPGILLVITSMLALLGGVLGRGKGTGTRKV